MVDIDRERKALLLPDESLVPYDHLVLAPELADRSLRSCKFIMHVSSVTSISNQYLPSQPDRHGRAPSMHYACFISNFYQ